MSDTSSLAADGRLGRYHASTPWSPFAAIAAGILIIVAAFGAVVAVVVVPLAEGTPQDEVMRWFAAHAIALFGGCQLIVVLLTLWVAGWFGGDRLRVLALGPGVPPMRVFAMSLVGMALVVAPYNAIIYLLSPSSMVGDLKPFAELLQRIDWWLLVAVVGVGAPLSEELFFRGFLQSAFAQSRLGYVGAALITTATWTVLHAGYSVAGLLEVFLIGLYFNWVLWRTGSLWVTIFCHGFYNTLLLALLRTIGLPT
jgi:uncharacterized protein